MIEGKFGENRQVYFEIDLIGGDNFSFPVETMLNIEFTELLEMNKSRYTKSCLMKPKELMSLKILYFPIFKL